MEFIRQLGMVNFTILGIQLVETNFRKSAIREPVKYMLSVMMWMKYKLKGIKRISGTSIENQA